MVRSPVDGAVCVNFLLLLFLASPNNCFSFNPLPSLTTRLPRLRESVTFLFKFLPLSDRTQTCFNYAGAQMAFLQNDIIPLNDLLSLLTFLV